MRVLALDPGSRVGWAAADVDPVTGEWDNLTHGITELWPMSDKVDEVAGNYDLIVIEDWRLYPDKAKTMVGSSFPSVQFIGAVKGSARRAGTKVVLQGAATKTSADKTMKAVRPELYELVTRPVAHDDGHDQDALRHLWFWTTKHTEVLSAASNA